MLMRFLSAVWLAVGLLASVSASAFAPLGPGPFAPNTWAPDPSTASIGQNGGASVSRSGFYGFTTPQGDQIKVPVGVNGFVSTAKLVGGALGCIPPFTVIGAVSCAATAAMVVNELKNSGLFGTCPNGSTDFICKPTGDVSDGWTYSVNSGGVITAQFPTTIEACNAWLSAAAANDGHARTFVGVAWPQCQFTGPTWGGVTVYVSMTRTSTSCAVGWYWVGSVCTQTAPMVTATVDDIRNELNARAAADYAANQRMYDAMKADEAANPQTFPAPARPITVDQPVTVTAPPVTSPARQISQEQIANPDGTTSTRTRTAQTTVNPTTTGTTAGDTQITYPSATTVTTVTTNNTTNVTTTETSTTNNASPLPSDFPTDYNREATQKQIETDLNTDSVGPAPADQEARTKTATDATDQSLSDKFTALPNELSADKTNWFSWVWTPPIGVCAPYSGVVHGYSITFDICPTVAMIREALGFLFALFAAWNIYGLIFRGES